MVIVLTFLVLFYTVFIGISVYGWLRIKTPVIPRDYQPTTFISVLIPFRNEEKHLPELLQDFLTQTYPKALFEIILIDDHSEDTSLALAERFQKEHPELNLKLLQLKNGRGEGKKSALTFGLESAQGKLIVQTDADCRVQPEWLTLHENLYATGKTKFISGPVCLEDKGTFFGKLQVVEFASLIVTGAASIGIGKPNMCNGANLAFEKEAFFAVNGYSDNEKIASGDDEFLMHIIHKQFPGQVQFLKAAGATVYTSAQPNLKAFLNQRIRWASKWKYYDNLPGQFLALLIFAVNAGLFLSFFGWLFGSLNAAGFWLPFIIKSAADIVILACILTFFRRLSLLIYFLPLQLVYTPYVVYCALAGLKGNYHWKGRHHRNP